MARDITAAVREICLSFPESQEVLSHGAPNFRIRDGKIFAMYTINHHGDGRIALWLAAAEGAQEMYVREEPKHFFVPPYVGTRGWLGVRLDKGISWKRVAELVRESYEIKAPRALSDRIGKTIVIKPPTRSLSAEQIDPLQSKRALTVLKKLRGLIEELPESSETTQFGALVWKAGKKTFIWMRADEQQRLTLMFWTGVEQQSLLMKDRRFFIPPYIGHSGWIALDVSKQCDWGEVRSLLLFSYRHFALRRMLKLMGE
jgi:hypothetical protein